MRVAGRVAAVNRPRTPAFAPRVPPAPPLGGEGLGKAGDAVMALVAATAADGGLYRVQRYRAATWLVNTGCSGRPYGVGARMPLSVTRAIIPAT